jgi:hypothetical protein
MCELWVASPFTSTQWEEWSSKTGAGIPVTSDLHPESDKSAVKQIKPIHPKGSAASAFRRPPAPDVG